MRRICTSLTLALAVACGLGLGAPVAGAEAPRAVDGLIAAGDLAGPRPVRVRAPAAWLGLLGHAGTRARGARTSAFVSAAGSQVAVVSRAAIAPASAARTLRAVRAVRWTALDRRSAGSAVAWRRAVRTTWHAGGLIGQIEVVAPRALARPLLSSLVARARRRALARSRRTAWDAVVARIPPNGRVSVRTALQAFSLAVAPVPGVPLPPGPRGRIGEGSMAVRWVLGRLGEMRPVQRRAVEAALARLRPPSRTAGRARAAAGWVADEADRNIAVQAALDIYQRLGVPLTLALEVGRGPVKDQGADMVTQPSTPPGATEPDTCVITVGPRGLKYVGKPAAYRALITHEVFHCFQIQIGGTAAYSGTKTVDGSEVADRNWLYEGGANWAACEVAPDPEASYIPESVDEFIVTPEVSLFERSYAALGLFRLLTGRGIDLWPRWPTLLRAGGDAATFDELGADAVLDSWASYTARRPGFGPAWDLASRCVSPGGPDSGRTVVPLVDDRTVLVGTPAYTTRNYEIRSDADVVTFRVPGHARLGAESTDVTDLAERSYCTDPGGCRCPVRAGPVPVPPPLGDAPALLALTGGRTGTRGQVVGRTIYDYCRVKPLQLIVPGRSVGKVYLGQTRRSVRRTVSGLRAGSPALGLDRSPILFQPGGLAGVPALNIAFGLCNPATLDEGPGALAACRRLAPKGDPGVVGGVATASTDYATRQGLGPGSPADAVVARVGSGSCRRDVPGDPQSAWDSCTVPGADANRFTHWGFTGSAGNETVLAVAVFDTEIVPAAAIGAGGE